MNDGKKEPIWNHLQELASRLKVIVIAIVIVMIIVAFLPASLFPFDSNYHNQNSSENPMYETLLSYILKKIESDLLPENAQIMAQSWTSLIETYFLLSLAIAIIICFPLIIYEIYKFISPALYENERKIAIHFIFISSVLFLFGMILSYTLILPITFKILMIFVYTTGALPLISLDNFIFLVVAVTLGTGFVFTSPLILYFLIKAGIVNKETIKRRRKYFYAAIIIIVMILTPDPTLISDIIILFPLIILLEISLYIAGKTKK
ncbi:MAG: twin-arginine translocase subunit TatC [Candidatus Altarchaeaceae archaeon]